jgi:hypothetical protein
LLTKKRVKLGVDAIAGWKSGSDPVSERFVHFILFANLKNLTDDWVGRRIGYSEFLIQAGIVLDAEDRVDLHLD